MRQWFRFPQYAAILNVVHARSSGLPSRTVCGLNVCGASPIKYQPVPGEVCDKCLCGSEAVRRDAGLTSARR